MNDNKEPIVNSTTRRRFLHGSMAVSGLAAVASQLPAAEGKADESGGGKLRISILSYSFRGLLEEGKMDVFGYLESCKYRYGLDAADLWNGFLPSLEEDYLKKVREGLDERGLELADLAVDRAHVWEDDPDKREQNYRNARAHLDAARITALAKVACPAASRFLPGDRRSLRLAGDVRPRGSCPGAT